MQWLKLFFISGNCVRYQKEKNVSLQVFLEVLKTNNESLEQQDNNWYSFFKTTSFCISKFGIVCKKNVSLTDSNKSGALALV